MPKVTEIEILEDRTATARCDEGFLRLKRLRARNRRSDGSLSRDYPIDLIDRPTLDAVAVCAYIRIGARVEVLTRHGLRPAAYFRKGKQPALPEGTYLRLEELVAGVVEPGEQGLEALKRRAAEELGEEAGIDVPLARIRPLGGPVFMLPGIASEKIHIFAAEVDATARKSAGPYDAPELGDGSPLEEGGELRWRELGAGIAACLAGEIEDAKTELAWRRLRDELDGQA